MGAARVFADVPMLLTQGTLTNSSGGAPKNGTFTMGFTVYDAETGGNQLPSGTPWQETQSVQVTTGVFNVLLGSVVALPATLFEAGPSDSAGPLRFLEVTVDGEVLSPRRRIVSAAYAIHGSQGTNISTFDNIEVFTSNGTWIRPPGVSTVWVKVWGGGGGGCSGCDFAGGGGGYAEDIVTVTDDVTVNVGGGGSGGTPAQGSEAATPGGQSSFGALVVADGGKGPLSNGNSNGGDGLVGRIRLSGGPGQRGVDQGAGGEAATLVAEVGRAGQPIRSAPSLWEILAPRLAAAEEQEATAARAVRAHREWLLFTTRPLFTVGAMLATAMTKLRRDRASHVSLSIERVNDGS